MAIADPIPEFSRPPTRTGFALLVMMAPLPTAQLEGLLAKLATSFPPDDLLIATQNEIATRSSVIPTLWNRSPRPAS